MIRPHPISLRGRLLAGMALVAGVLVAVSLVITITTRRQLIDQVDARLQSFAPEAHEDGHDHEQPADDDDSGRLSDAYQGFIEADGTLTTRYVPNIGGDYSPPALDTAELAGASTRTFTTGSENGAHTYRVLVQDLGDTTAVTALPIDEVQSTISRLVWVEALGSALILIALAIVSWWVLHLGIRPVRRMTETATRIADGDLSVRVPEGTAGTESGALAVALNRMLTTINSALDERAESEARLRRFVADASHELRTPVTTIRGYAELYRHGGLSDSAALDDAMRRTEQEAMRMGRLVEDMLLLAKLDEQRPLESRPVDLAALARDAVSDARATAPSRSITFESDGGDATVDGDEDRLRQVITNIVGNAMVHTDPEVPVELRVRTDDGRVRLEVEDHGPGMPADVLARATERFFRADPSRARRRGGSGLGLSIVDATVSAHGGNISITSEPGRGTTVTVDLPAATAGAR